MAMIPGHLDELITIKQPESTRDEYGAPQVTWSTVMRAWANVEAVAGQEAYRSDQLIAQRNARAMIRHTTNTLDATMRVHRGDGSVWDVAAVDPLPGRKRGFELRLKSTDRAGAA